MTREIVIGVVVAGILALLAFLGGILSQGALVNALGGVIEKEVGGQGVVERLAALQNKVAELEERQPVDVTQLEARIATLEAHGWLPSGTVVAIDRADGCPDAAGWGTFAPAISRTIIGAGTPAQNIEEPLRTDERGRNLTSRKYREHGGIERHTLDRDELPPFVEEVSSDLKDHGSGPGTLDVVVAVLAEKKSGDANPHDNMPPYIALYFCKYEGRQG